MSFVLSPERSYVKLPKDTQTLVFVVRLAGLVIAV